MGECKGTAMNLSASQFEMLTSTVSAEASTQGAAKAAVAPSNDKGFSGMAIETLLAATDAFKLVEACFRRRAEKFRKSLQ
jgi:hypothetical protein